MLLRIEVTRLRLGMFIESIDGSWLDNRRRAGRRRRTLVGDADIALYQAKRAG